MSDTPPDINPYAISGMIRDCDRFYGRAEILREIRTRLLNMGSVSIIGDRRIGKSSLLYYLAHCCTENYPQDFDFVYLDVLRLHNEDMFYKAIAEKLKQPIDNSDDLSIAVRESKKRLVWCIDEFERTTEGEGYKADFFDVLRSLGQSGNLALVIATKTPLDKMDYGADRKTSAFFNTFTPFQLKPLPEDEVHKLLTAPAQICEQEFIPAELATIHELVGKAHIGQPYFLNMAASIVFDAKSATPVPSLESLREKYQYQVAYTVNAADDEAIPSPTDAPPSTPPPVNNIESGDVRSGPMTWVIILLVIAGPLASIGIYSGAITLILIALGLVGSALFILFFAKRLGRSKRST